MKYLITNIYRSIFGKEVKVQRTILVTVVKDRTGTQSQVFGRQDLVALYNKGLTPVDSFMAVYEMSDEDFAKYGKFKKRGKEL